MKNKPMASWITVAAFWLLSGISHAMPVTLGFEGYIRNATVVTADPFNGQISVGTTFKGTYSFDTNIPNSGTPEYGIYESSNPSFGINLSVGGLSDSSSSAQRPLNYRIILNQGHTQDIQTQDVSFGGVNAFLIQVILRDFTLTALPDVSLSSEPPDLAKYQTRDLALGIGENGRAEAVYIGTITSIYSIPEPSALALLGLALGCMAVQILRNRRNSGDSDLHWMRN